MSKIGKRKYESHAFQDRADRAYNIKAQKKIAADNKKKREAILEAARVAHEKALAADVAISLVENTDGGEARMLVAKIVHGKP